MVDVHVIPTSPGYSGTTQNLLVEVSERICKSYPANGFVRPSVSATYSAGATKIVGTSAVIPITAVVTVITPSADCGCAVTQIFTETFNIAFASTGTNTATLTQGQTLVEPLYVRCCKARGIKASTVLSVTIA